MLDQIMNTQTISDLLKDLLSRHRATSPAERTAASNALTQLETLPWVQPAFEDALAESPFEITEHNLAYDQSSAVTPHQAVAQLVAHYRALVLPPDDAPLDIRAAAAYLNVSVPTIKHHVYNTGLLEPLIVGSGNRKTLLFTRTMLDKFQASRRPAGNPNLMDDAPSVDMDEIHAQEIISLARRLREHSPRLAEDLIEIADAVRAGKYD